MRARGYASVRKAANALTPGTEEMSGQAARRVGVERRVADEEAVPQDPVRHVDEHVEIRGGSQLPLVAPAFQEGPQRRTPLRGEVRQHPGNVNAVDHLVLALSRGAVAVGPLAEVDEGALRDAFDGKFFAHFNILKAALPKLGAGSSVTFITAASARAAFPGSAGLAAVNGALEAMVPPLAAELAPVRVNAVSPGVIDTAWWAGMPEPDRAAFFEGAAAGAPVGRVGKPEDIASSVLYLAGNGFVTGTVLECTGGANLATGR
jgi:NAD(P)-dependent dehydrogenase (short-subunit alcohol dehydrogenase family)